MSNRTFKAGDRVNVHNQAGGFLSNDYGHPMSWVVARIGTGGMAGMLQLHGKQHQWQIGNGWYVNTADCELVS